MTLTSALGEMIKHTITSKMKELQKKPDAHTSCTACVILSYLSILFIQQPALSEQSLVTIYEEGVVILLHMLPDHKGVLIFFLRLFENFTSKHNCQPR